MSFSNTQYKLYPRREHRKICNSLRDVVKLHYPNYKVIFYSYEHSSIVISSDIWIVTVRNSILFPWEVAKISPAELDVLLAMEKL